MADYRIMNFDVSDDPANVAVREEWAGTRVGDGWESVEATGFTLNDLDHEEILRTLRLGLDADRLPDSTGRDVGDILDQLQLRRNGQVLNAAVALFAACGARFEMEFPQCRLRLARFLGNDKSAFIDSRQAHGNVFRLLDEARFFMMRHLPISGRFEPGRIERIDEPLYPVAALREAVVNALCHRTYRNVGGAVSIAIYDNRLEIWSDGLLPFGLVPEDLRRIHESRPRNPLIADVFYRRGSIEQWGRGTQRIVELCTRAGRPEPEFGQQAGSFWVRFLAGDAAPRGRFDRLDPCTDSQTAHGRLDVSAAPDTNVRQSGRSSAP